MKNRKTKKEIRVKVTCPYCMGVGITRNGDDCMFCNGIGFTYIWKEIDCNK